MMESVPSNKVYNKENLDNFASSIKCDYKEAEVIDPTFKSSQQSKYFSSDKLIPNSSQEQNLKSSLPSLLDTYCKTSILNESDDFIHCNSKNKVYKKEANGKSNKTKPALKSKRNESEIKINKTDSVFQTEKWETMSSVEKSESLSTSDKNEVLKCEICKEDITCLDVYSRSAHVNNCIDKQISKPPEQNVTTTERSDPESVFILECPLCFKHFPSPELRANHIKKCGKSKGLSVLNIIKAMELQERHALERISLGLPAKPIKPVKSNKGTVPKRTIVEPKNKAQSDIQLAKALSLSLTNSNKQNGEEDSSNITFVTLKPPTAQQYPGKKNKKIIATPLLVLRTEEERKKLMLDKVATIVTPQNVSDSPMDVEDVLTERKKEKPNMFPLLWQLSCIASEKHEYYVENLLHWIQPSDVEVGAKFCHLSQIAGHEIVTQLPCEYTFSTQEEQSTCELSEHCDSPPSLIGSLRSLVASSWMSDLDIHTACGTVIPAHRLLLAIRCPPLKQDLDFCSKIGRVCLKWENTSFDVALQFLNFIYTGSIEIEDNMKSDLLHLANKYEVSDLQKLLLANENNSKEPNIELKENVTEDIDTKSSSFAMNCHYQSHLEMEENDICITQEETNIDLDIVYNCINSSLKPSQSYLSKSPTQKAETSFQYTNETKDNFHGSLDLNYSKPESIKNSVKLQKYTVYSNFSQEQRSMSPVIFDVNDSDNDLKSESENDSIELPANCSQKSDLKEYHLEERELDLCNTESNSSQDSVKFLQSSFSVYNSLPCTPLKRTNCPLTMSPKFSISPLKKESLSPVINISKNFEKSVATYPEKITEVSESQSEIKLDEFCVNNYHSTPASQSSMLINFIHSSLQSPESRNTCTAHQTELSPAKSLDKEKVDNNYEFEVLIKDRSFIPNNEDPALQKMTFTECESSIGRCMTPSKKSSFTHHNELSNAETFEPVRSPWSLNKVASPEVFICDSDSNPKSPMNIPDEEITSEQEKFPPSQMKFNFSQISVESPETFPNTAKTKKLLGDVFENENSNNHPSTSNGLTNSLSSVSPLKRNARSPVVICFSSDEDEQITTGQSSPKTEFSSNLNCHEFKERVSCTNLPNEEVINSIHTDFPKSFATTFEYYVDPPYEYDDYCEPDISSPVTVKSKVFESTPPQKTESVTVNHKTKIVTPTVTNPQFRLSDSPITPFPDYKNMDTPGIKEALQKIGVKALSRKKAVELLKHVYNETHPLVNGEPSTENDFLTRVSKSEKLKKRKKLKDDTKPAKRKQIEINSPEKFSTTQESDDSGTENPEWQGCVPEISFTQLTQDSPSKTTKDDLDLIKQYIQSNEELYSNILTYTPLNLVVFHQELKENGIKISIQKLMDFFDEQCITFTCPRKEEYRKKQTARTQRFRKNMIAKLSQQTS